jgi:hypothetical protein
MPGTIQSGHPRLIIRRDSQESIGVTIPSPSDGAYITHYITPKAYPTAILLTVQEATLIANFILQTIAQK